MNIMATWALVVDGRVNEITDIDPTYRYPIDWKWYPCEDDVVFGWVAEEVDGVMTFRPYVPPPLTESQIFDQNKGAQNWRLSVAAEAMAPVLLSLQLGDSTDEETVIAKQWQTYYRELKAVDLTQLEPVWPTPPETV